MISNQKLLATKILETIKELNNLYRIVETGNTDLNIYMLDKHIKQLKKELKLINGGK